jgi:6-phosphofructokinase 1
VIRSIVLTLTHAYGVQRILGYRYGYAGLGPNAPEPPVELTPERVESLHGQGGTVLASSRGPQDVALMVEALDQQRIEVLFAIGGDGTLRGAAALADEIKRRGLPIAVVGVPKTIDNDLEWIDRSFGFSTAVEQARRAIAAAHIEARGAWNGIGLVELMGRHSGFIAAHACLANPDVNFCLVPEVPFPHRGFGRAALGARAAARSPPPRRPGRGRGGCSRRPAGPGGAARCFGKSAHARGGRGVA